MLRPAHLPLLLATCASCDAPPAPALPSRVEEPARHVLLVVIDTLRADRVGVFGGAADASIYIDEIARLGVRFEHAVAQSSWTAPSMVSLHISRYLSARRLRLPEELPTLAELFQQAGFGTAAFVTNPLIDEKNGFDRGFDEFNVYRGGIELEELEDWVRRRAGRPSFTYVHISDPHDPYSPPGHLLKRERVPLDPDTHELLASESERRGLLDLEGSLQRIEEQLALYEGEVRKADRTVARIVGALAEAGELDEACIAITSDHGEGLWQRVDAQPFIDKRYEHGEPRTVETVFKQRHGGQLHQELIRVPLVMRAPGLPRGLSFEHLVENVDLAPTLLELAGLDRPGALHGKSLVGLVSDPESWTKEEAFSMTRFAYSITTAEGLKLILPTETGARHTSLETELYDLRADPGERTNLCAERPEIVARLSARIELFVERGLGAHDPAAQEQVDRNLEALRQLGYVGEEDSALDPPR